MQQKLVPTSGSVLHPSTGPAATERVGAHLGSPLQLEKALLLEY